MTRPERGELSKSDLHSLLSHERRRLIVRCLDGCSDDHPWPQTIIDLAVCVGTRECESPSIDSLQRIYLALYHWHLPKLEAAGVLTYDWEDGTVAKGRNFEALTGIMDRLNETEPKGAGGSP